MTKNKQRIALTWKNRQYFTCRTTTTRSTNTLIQLASDPFPCPDSCFSYLGCRSQHLHHPWLHRNSIGSVYLTMEGRH
ncbi:uncharacterized protein PHALS_03227 [Plasmopara halstedii]|uniref:Uncharacterized protein n=1 Tax=Plasmopara halstedii TaxID=4781 RepID=A0A0P1AY57_PLAHL|nr:uncharacterized protein PHALS_03227 [Plasmopara halstedii]CEG46629.1 hypothetical protein PHALS_03227 [Plasmopara halstedii]|eukprot:XP_024582998.1 hypothetical protein PHALS_03227 [Plasmopara halstedii]